jgi:hypothetical protein
MTQIRWSVVPTGVLIYAIVLSGCGSQNRTPSVSIEARRATSTTLLRSSTTASPQTSTSSPMTAPRGVLPPATVAPVSDECNLPLVHEEDGNVIPLLCPSGGVNVLAWQHYARGWVLAPPPIWSRTMQLGPNASPTSVFLAMCFDQARVNGTNPLTISDERLAAAYYGWTFADTRISNFSPRVGDCPASSLTLPPTS